MGAEVATVAETIAADEPIAAAGTSRLGRCLDRDRRTTTLIHRCRLSDSYLEDQADTRPVDARADGRDGVR